METLVGLVMVAMLMTPVHTAQADEVVPAVVLPAVNDPVDAALDKLIKCESGGNAKVRVLDTNGKYSYGIMQFQLNTFWRYGMKYGILPSMPMEQARNYIYNPEKQKAIARKMLAEPGGWKHWANCSRKMGVSSMM